MKLDVRTFSLTCAIFWSLCVLIVTWWIIFFDGAKQGPTLLGRLYRGYSVTPLGSLIGFIWAFVDGYVGGAIFAWLYNKLLKKK